MRVLARHDRFDRFVSVLVFVPRERYDSDIRAKIGAYLARAFIGRVSAFYPYFPGEGSLVRVHFIIGRSGGGAPPDVDRATLEREVSAIIRTWTDGLGRALELLSPPDKARELFNRYRDAFSEGFHEAYAPTVAAGDIRVIEGLSEQRPLGVDFHHRLEEEQRSVGLKVWTFARPLAAVRARAGAGKHGLSRRGRAHLPHRAARRAPASGCTTCCSSVPTAA